VSRIRRGIRRRPVLAATAAGLLGFLLWGGAISLGGGAPWRSLAFSSCATAAAGALAALAGIAAIRRAFARGGAIGAVAQVLVAETVRRRVAAISIGLLFGGLALLPLLLRANPVLEHRLASLVSYGLFLAFFLLSVITVFSACGSLCEEIADRRIHALATKPAGRGRILLGKWLALVLFDTALLAAAGGVILASVHLEIARARAAGGGGAEGERILVTRRLLEPGIPAGLASRVAARVDALLGADPEALARSAEEFGGDERAALLELRTALWREELLAWRSVPPGERREYRFSAPPESAEGTLRLRPELGRLHSTERIRFLVTLEGTTQAVFIGGGETASIAVPASALADGSLEVAVENPAAQEFATRTAILSGTDMIVLEVPAGLLAANLARALAILAIQLGFVAALGLASATFLGLPVAVLLVAVTLLAAAGGSIFLGAESPLDSPGHSHGHDHDHGAGAEPSLVVRAADRLGRAVLGVLSVWGSTPAIGPASAGEEIPLSALARCLGWIGGVWTGLAAVIGAAVFRRRELARVQV
jgi:hypothetical protein